MGRFDVYRNKGAGSVVTPYLMDVQSNYLQGLNSRVVIPLRLLEAFPSVPLPRDLTPLLVVEGRTCFLDTPKMAAIPVKELGKPLVSLPEHHDAVRDALDRLHGAF